MPRPTSDDAGSTRRASIRFLDVGGIETNELPEYAEREAMLLHEAATDYLGPIGVRSWRGVSR